MNQKNLDKFIEEALLIEADAAKEAGALGYMARTLIQATMPHNNPGQVEAWSRKNGGFCMIMQPGMTQKNGKFINIGLPYGCIPRLLLAWITTEAVKTKSPIITLGDTLSEFMGELGLLPTGGRWGTITRLKEQVRRLFSATISCSYDENFLKTHTNNQIGDDIQLEARIGFQLAKSYYFWWNAKSPDQSSLWQSQITLSTDFFNEIADRPVPIDMRALKVLKRSSMALDIYCWLTYRMSYLNRQTLIPWSALALQFGSDYARTRDFKKKFLLQLKKVSTIYKEAKLSSEENGLLLFPSKPHIRLTKTKASSVDN